MGYHRRATPFIAGILLVCFLRLSAPAVAHATSPTDVQVGAYVLNIGSFDVGKGTFSADFYIWFSWKGNWSSAATPDTPLPGGFELMNGIVQRSTLIESDKNVSGGYNYLIYRVQASMTDPVNLRAYPFDRHDLTIEVEDQDHSESVLVYQPDTESRLDALVRLQGWDIRSSGAGAYVTDHFYNTTFGFPGQKYSETYSRFIVSIPIERPVLASVVQTFIPIILILIVAMVSFLIKLEHFGTRVSFNVLTLLTAAAFQINLTSGIPQFGFLTLADRMMISVYVLLVYSLIITVGLATISGEKQLKRVKKLNESSAILFPIVAAVLLVGQFLI